MNQIELRDALLYVWSKALVDDESNPTKSKVPSSAIHRAVEQLAEHFKDLGVPLVFENGGSVRQSRQVSRAIDEFTPFGARYENPRFYVVLDRDRAVCNVEALRNNLDDAARVRLDSIALAFGEALRSASPASSN